MKDSCDYPILGREAEIADKPGKEPHCQGERDEEIQVSWICVQQRQRGTLYPCTPEITAESQEQAAGTDAQEPGEECSTDHEERQAVYDRMAELLWDSVHEEPNGRMEWMASQAIPSVHLEAMEEAKKQIPKPGKAGHSGLLCLDGVQQPECVLLHGRNHDRGKSHNK